MTRAKSILLASLVICSIVLAALIIFGQAAPRGGEMHPAPWFGPKPSAHEISLPGRIYLLGEEPVLVETLSKTYSNLVLTLGQMGHSIEGGDNWATAEFSENDISTGVLFRFDYPVSRGVLANWLQKFYETEFPFAAIDNIFIPLEGGPVKFINSSTGMMWLFQVDLPEAVFQQAVAEPGNVALSALKAMVDGDTYRVAPGVFDLAQPGSFTFPGGQFEKVDIDEIIQSFFLNPSIIRETDGTVTYTDGFGALQVFPSGLLDYTASRLEQGEAMLDQQKLVQLALDFLHTHGGWPGNMLPVFFTSTAAEPPRLEFATFARGLPITGEETGITVEMLNGRVSGYRRHLLRATPETAQAQVNPLSILLETDCQVSQLFAPGEKTIQDLALVLYWQQKRLVPAWRIRVQGQIIFAAADDGRIFQVKALRGER